MRVWLKRMVPAVFGLLTKADREQVCRWTAAMSRTLAAGDGVNKP